VRHSRTENRADKIRLNPENASCTHEHFVEKQRNSGALKAKRNNRSLHVFGPVLTEDLMPLLLAIETTAPLCSVSLYSDRKLLAARTSDLPRKHAEMLVPLIKECLQSGGCSMGPKDAIAVSAGPGSYTGLRIGASVAKGLAYATGARIVAVSTFEAMAWSGLQQCDVDRNTWVIPTAPSRREELYVSGFRLSETTELERQVPDGTVRTDALRDWLTRNGWDNGLITGPGCERINKVLGAIEGFRLVACETDASAVAANAWQRVDRGNFEETSSFEPSYLKAFVAKKPSRSAFERLPF